MNIIYLINSKEYNYHKKVAEDFVSVTGGSVIDMGDGTNLGARFYEINGKRPDVIITFDLAGHVLRTGNNTLSLNNIYARFAHILFHKTDHYGRDLKARQNLSMFTYIPVSEDPERYRRIYEDVPNILNFPEFNYKACNDEEHLSNKESIKKWWEEFKKDAMI